MLQTRFLLQVTRSVVRHVTAAAAVGKEYSTNYEQHASSTVNEDEMERFKALSNKWWQEHGEFQALHSLNKLRVPLIRDALIRQKRAKSEHYATEARVHKPLDGMDILDVGCGGGILSEALCRLGAAVLGIDSLEEGIEVARLHAACGADAGRDVGMKVRYECTTVEALVAAREAGEGRQYDMVVASEVVEHVHNPQHFLQQCCHLVKSGGSIVVTTINRTWLSYALAILAAERLLHIVPPGTHTHDKFITPHQLQHTLSQCGVNTELIHGMLYNPVTCKWHWAANTSVNYALQATKPPL